MTPAILMIIGGSALLGGIALAVINMLCFVAGEGKRFGLTFVVHALAALVAWLGGVALLGGFIWFMVMVIIKEVKASEKPAPQTVEAPVKAN